MDLKRGRLQVPQQEAVFNPMPDGHSVIKISHIYRKYIQKCKS